MIGSLKGMLIGRTENTLLLEVQGVGYEVFVSLGTTSTVQSKSELQIFVHTHVKEDEITLFGFSSLEERDFFRKLISVSGIGPKIGLEILNSPIDMIKEAIVSGDTAVLTRVKGLGKKTAERLILELKEKIDFISSPKKEGVSSGSNTEERSDAIEALVGLGYERYTITKTLHEAPGGLQTEELVRFFLKNV